MGTIQIQSKYMKPKNHLFLVVFFFLLFFFFRCACIINALSHWPYLCLGRFIQQDLQSWNTGRKEKWAKLLL